MIQVTVNQCVIIVLFVLKRKLCAFGDLVKKSIMGEKIA